MGEAAVAAMIIDVHLPACRSLKEKRSVLRPLREKLQRGFGVAVAEVEYQELWQRARLGVSAVSGTAGVLERLLDDVERYVWSRSQLEVIDVQRYWLETG